MAKIKMQTPDTSRSGRRRLVGSTGGIGVKDSSSSTRYPLSGTAKVDITKSAQYAGSGANVVFTQPMFLVLFILHKTGKLLVKEERFINGLVSIMKMNQK